MITRKQGLANLLQADYEAQGQGMWGAKILLLPTVIMNQNQYRGRLDTASIVRGLCSGFKENSEPEASSLPPPLPTPNVHHNCQRTHRLTSPLSHLFDSKAQSTPEGTGDLIGPPTSCPRPGFCVVTIRGRIS